MRLRKLRPEDAGPMLEWMHDGSVTRHLRHEFGRKTIDDCLAFIASAQDESESIHLAIADDHDEYMGTVSLKHIRRGTAELGIVLRSCAMGKGYAAFAVSAIMEYGFLRRRIGRVYWCVDPDNTRAVRFYDRNGYQRCGVPPEDHGYTDAERRAYLWYSAQR